MPAFCELFAGIGLVRDALEPLGWRCVYANDIDATKESIYRQRYPHNTHFERGDIWNLDAVILPPIDLITASFPCIDLSLAGNRKGLAGEHSGTFWAFIDILVQLRQRDIAPKALLIENVTGFLTSHSGKDFQQAVQALTHLGYVMDAIQVSAERFTPQSRPRLFILATRVDIAPDLMILPEGGPQWWATVDAHSKLRPQKVREMMLRQDGRWGIFDFPMLPQRSAALSDVIDWQQDDWWSSDRVEKMLMEMAPSHQQKVQALRDKPGLHVATAYRRRRDGRSVYELRTDGLAGCLRTATGGSSKQIVVAVDDGQIRVRWMAPLEYARLQGVSSIHELSGISDNDVRTAFGDAVCVPAYRWIADHAFRPLVTGENNYRQTYPQQLALFRERQIMVDAMAQGI